MHSVFTVLQYNLYKRHLLRVATSRPTKQLPPPNYPLLHWYATSI